MATCMLVGPHIARRLVCHDVRRVFFSALLTAALLLGADVVAQGLTIHPPVPSTTSRAGLPVGAVTALVEAPFGTWRDECCEEAML